MNILCVDDDPVYLLVLRTTLVRFNKIDVIKFTDTGEKALAIIASEKIDVLLTDLNLPGISGLELLKNLRKVNPDSEILVISGIATLNQAIDAMKLGACDFLLKPLNPTIICEKINTIRENMDKKPLVEKEKGNVPPETSSPVLKQQQQQIFNLQEALTDIHKIINADKIEPVEKIRTVQSILSRTLPVND